MSTDVLIFVETRTLQNEPLIIENYTLISCKDCGNTRENFGHAVFIRESKLKNDPFYNNSYQNFINVSGLIVNNTAIIFVYNKSDAPFSNLETMLKEVFEITKQYMISNIIIIGDFNIDLRCDTDQKTMSLETLMKHLKLIHVTPLYHSSTD